jgi:hypothetical protein
MSRASSLTPAEQNAAIKSAATMSDQLFTDDLAIFAKAINAIRVKEQKLEEIRRALQALDPNAPHLQALNTDVHVITLMRAQIRNDIAKFFEAQKNETAEKNIDIRFVALQKANPKYKHTLDEIDKYRYIRPEIQPILGGSPSSESKSDKEFQGKTQVFRDAMIQVLDDTKEIEFLTEIQMVEARKYNKSVIINYLLKEMYENYKSITQLETPYDEIEKNLEKLQKILNLPDVNKARVEFIKELEQMMAIESQVSMRDKKGAEVFVKIKLLTPKAHIENILELDKLISASYYNFNHFQATMLDFRKNQHYRMTMGRKNYFYSVLPDLAAESNGKHFPLIDNKNENEHYMSTYRQYNTQVRAVGLPPAKLNELAELHTIIISNIDATIKNNYVDGAIKLMALNLKNVVGIDENVLGSIVAIMAKVLGGDHIVSNDVMDAKLIEILKETTVLSIIEKLEQYAAAGSNRHQELRNHISFLINQLSIPPELNDLLRNPLRVAQFKEEIVEYNSLKQQAANVEATKKELQQAVTDRIDIPLIKLLRAQVLHAAKLYFNPSEKPGMLHWFHHGFSGDASVLQLLYDLFSPNIQNFSDAVQCVTNTLARHAEGKGLHTNSFDTLLSFILYNEGTPLGLFKMKLADVVTLNVERFYPDYRADDLRYQPAHVDITKADVKAIREHLKDGYRLPDLRMAGKVSSMVRGQERLEQIDQRNIVREQMRDNLSRMAAIIQQFKEAPYAEEKIEARAARRL